MSNERLRLKDRILDRIAKAIKEIQGLQLGATNQPVVLNHEVRPVQKLVEHLDHALLHGLRHVTPGYWVVIPHFTRKDIIRQISILPNITTDLGRGRAWLYIALNESLVESYLRCIAENKKTIRKFYVEHALMRDDQRMMVLQTLASGLDYVTFDLDLSVPYLDLASYLPAKKRTDSEDEYDRISHHSLDTMSLSSFTSGVQDDIGSQFGDEPVTPSDVTDVSSLTSKDLDGMSSDFGFHSVTSNDPYFTRQDSIDSLASATKEVEYPLSEDRKEGIEKDEREAGGEKENKPERPTSLGHIFRSNRIETMCDSNTGQTDLEVIHLNGKKQKKSKKKKKSPLNKNNSSEFPSPINDLKVVIEEAVMWGDRTNTMTKTSNGFQLTNQKEASNALANQTAQEIQIQKLEEPSSVNHYELSNQVVPVNQVTNEELDVTSLDAHVMHVKQKLANEAAAKVLQEQVQDEKDRDTTFPKTAESSHNSKEVCQNKLPEEVQQTVTKVYSNNTPGNNIKCETLDSEDNQLNIDGDKFTAVSQATSAMVTTDTVDDDVNKGLPVDATQVINANLQSSTNEDEVKKDTCISHVDGDCAGSHGDDKDDGEKKSIAEEKDDNPESDQRMKGAISKEDKVKTERQELTNDADMKIDNNTKLYLMLEIFKTESEEFQKLIRMNTGHMEGEVDPVFILLTDQSMYLLRKGSGQTLYHTEVIIPYNELDYLSISVNYQTITVVCTNRRNQYWLTTGDEQLTRYFLSVLMKAMEDGSRTRELPSVLRDATTQLITIRKFASQECRCEPSEVNLILYSLVHWEDLSDKPTSDRPKPHTPYKEGVLLFKSWDGYLFGGNTWKPGFFLLRNGMFYRLLQRNDPVPQLAISLKSGDFGGCRRVRGGEKPYSFELIMPDKSSLELAANDDYEVSEWLHSICSAVSLGMEQPSPTSSPCIACCMVLTKQKLIMCHEDIQTGFFRCLGSCQVENIGGITVDPDNRHYCIVEFEASDTSSDHEQPWVVYFNSPVEEAKFELALGKAWKNIFQVDIPVFVIESKTIRSRCREQHNLLQSAWKKNDSAMSRKEFEALLQ
ncbi:pleckstrin homology domain-containing family M member 2-like [Glandiceps talaboti]